MIPLPPRCPPSTGTALVSTFAILSVFGDAHITLAAQRAPSELAVRTSAFVLSRFPTCFLARRYLCVSVLLLDRTLAFLGDLRDEGGGLSPFSALAFFHTAFSPLSTTPSLSAQPPSFRHPTVAIPCSALCVLIDQLPTLPRLLRFQSPLFISFRNILPLPPAPARTVPQSS